MPQRIVSLLPGVTEILYAIDAGDRVVGVSHECDFPFEANDKPAVTRSYIDSAASSLGIDQQVRQSNSSTSLYALEKDRLRQLRPDLIVTQSQCDVCAVSLDEVVAFAEREPALKQTQILALNPQSLNDVWAAVEQIGQATGSASASSRLIASLQTRLAAVKRAVGAQPNDDRVRVLCVEWIEPIMLAGNWIPELIESAGGLNGLARAGEPSRYWEWSSLVEFDPDVLLIAPCGFDVSRSLQEVASLKRLEGWCEMKAIQQRRAVVLDGNAYVTRLGPRLVDTIELLAHLFYPRLWPFEKTPAARTTGRLYEVLDQG